MDRWRGGPGPFGVIAPGVSGGGGYESGASWPGRVLAIWPGSAGGGGHVPSSTEPLTGYGGCGGPGPGAFIGLGEAAA